MSQNENKPSGPDRRGSDSNFNWRGFMILAFAIALVSAGILMNTSPRRAELTFTEFQKKLTEQLGKPAVVGADGVEISPKVEPGKKYFSVEDPIELANDSGSGKSYLRGKMLDDKLGKTGFSVEIILGDPTVTQEVIATVKKLWPNFNMKQETSMWGSFLMSILPILLILVLLYFLFRAQIKMAGRGAMNFGKSRARMLSMDKNKITFKNVAGVEEAKEEVWELVEFLKDPKKFQRLGGRIPKGVLMVGPPGTGKTLLAKAIAGEADVPFFSISGSDFVEMFVGVGASRVRDMFEQGKKNAPCLIFIDEIDAVGRHRGHGLGGGHDEREQTLNALLVEMDGFDTQEGVIIIAATNRPDVLDPALLRPGRFDRQVTVNLPDVKGREAILKVHSKKVKMSAEVDLAVIARGTPGYSGAELANVINEAALLAARKNLKAITLRELEEARDKVRWGKERRSLALSEKEKENTAYHEAGHAICLVGLEHTEPLHKVTIIPRGPSLGSTMWLPQEDKYNTRKKELLDSLVVAMGGRVAEDIVFGDVTSGASGDIKMATHLAKKMVCEWGMSDELGMVEYGDSNEHVFLARDLGRTRDYSEATAQKIDIEIKRLIDTAYQRAKDLLEKNRKQLDAIAKALLEYETLDASHIREIMETGSLQNPPQSRPPAPPVEAKLPQAESALEEGGLPGGLAGAPA